MDSAEFWKQRIADSVLLDVRAVEAHSDSLLLGADPPVDFDIRLPVDAERTSAELSVRFDFLRAKIERSEYLPDVDVIGALSLPELNAWQSALRTRTSVRDFRVAETSVELWCGPFAAGLFTSPRDPAFNRNLCSVVREQEVVEILAEHNGVWLVRTSYAVGFVATDRGQNLSPLTSDDLIESWTSRRQWTSRDGAILPATPNGMALRMQDGQVTATTGDGALSPRSLTRHALLDEVFRYLGTPYGWGGYGGGRDCSRLLLDVFGSFGLALPRHSARQALSGVFSVSVEGLPVEQKELVLERLAPEGALLLYFPGHIMFYLGRVDGRDYVLHSFSEYLEPCASGERVVRVDRVAVSDLSLGERTSRTSFLQRLTRIAVFGPSASVDWMGVAEQRPLPPVQSPPEACSDSTDIAIFSSPRVASQGSPLRVIATSSNLRSRSQLSLFDPQGQRVSVASHRLGGPPFSEWLEARPNRVGVWTAVLAEGSDVIACEHIRVGRVGSSRAAIAPEPALPETDEAVSRPAWESRWQWEVDTENLFSAWVEQLFKEPTAEGAPWRNLQVLLSDPQRNLLLGHRGLAHEQGLELEPDCADLPYVLRAYFAWQTSLPFAWRDCSRGRDGRAPSCSAEIHSHLDAVAPGTDGEAFSELVRGLRMNVHSSSNRTRPQDENSDVYPVSLRRESLRPGVVYADPYGHVLVLTGWQPQTFTTPGALMAADAQPDASVGLRRFWRGSFLFSPDTTLAGAGFKAWRPVRVERDGSLRVLRNAELGGRGGFTAYSDEQYRVTRDRFYELVDGVANPLPQDASLWADLVLSSFASDVERRVTSVALAEEFLRAQPQVIGMPEGAAIFQTAGPWEDYSTPSRDLRLLVSIDYLRSFAEVVRSFPERFGIVPELAEEKSREAAERIRTFLDSHSITYRDSSGQPVQLTLAEVVRRAEYFEMAYNPNDCVEIRWGGGASESEMRTCRRRAPDEQRQRMETFRPWFTRRERPAR